MKATNWHCENDIKVGIVLLAINRLWFKDKRPVCGDGIALWVMKTAVQAEILYRSRINQSERTKCFCHTTTLWSKGAFL